MKIDKISHTAFMARGIVNKINKPFCNKIATYTMLGIMSLAAGSCGDAYNKSPQSMSANNTTITQPIEPTTNVIIEPAKTELGLNSAQKDAIKYLFQELYHSKVNIVEKKNDAVLIKGSGNGEDWYYNLKHTSESITLVKSEHLYGSWFYKNGLITIKNLDNGGFTVSMSDMTFEFDKVGRVIPEGARKMHQASTVKTELDKVKILDKTNKEMLANIITSMNINNIDILEQDDYVELYGENKDASYQFIVRKGENNSVYGIANKMLANANLQTEISSGSSEIYAFRCTDKSTDNAKRMQVTSMRVVQSDINNSSDIQAKYKERTGEHHVVDNYKVARGLLGGADIMATNEKTFTTKYLSEGAENRIYTLDDKGWLKINGQYAFSNKL